jgi:hypothetical protein
MRKRHSPVSAKQSREGSLVWIACRPAAKRKQSWYTTFFCPNLPPQAPSMALKIIDFLHEILTKILETTCRNIISPV